MPDGWVFLPDVPAYVSPGGDTLPLSAMRGIVDIEAETSRVVLRGIADDLAAGKINAAEFGIRVQAEVKQLHLAARMLGVGGRAQMTGAELGKAGRMLRTEYGFLDQFVAAVKNGELSDAQIAARVQMYAGANAIGQFENGRHGCMLAAGYAEKQRVLGGGEHCATCLNEAGQGWVPIDKPGWVLGASECRYNCHCTIEYRGKDWD